jgi:hypothetical protein
MTNKAIIIKGPSADCKSYFTGLPDTLEELIQKASKLFPVPPNHTAHLMLEGDDAILMPDVLRYLKDREVLTFHWTANTPRSSLRQPSRKSEEMSRLLNSSGGSSSGSNESGSRTSRGVRWDQSVLLKNDVAMSRSNSEGNGSGAHHAAPAAKPFRYSSAARAEHSKRVLSEQQEQRERMAAKHVESEQDPFRQADSETQSTTMSSDIEPPNTSPQTAQHEVATDPTSLGKTSMSTATNVPSLSPSDFTIKDISAPAQSDEEQQNSSPLASPTRNIRGAQKSNSEWGTPLGTDKRQTSPAIEKQAEAVVAVNSGSPPSNETVVTQIQVPAVVKKAGSSSPSEEDRILRQTEVAYKRMASVVETLRHHPANVFFKNDFDETTQPFVDFLKGTGRPAVNLSIISERISKRSYRRTTPFHAFAADLSQLWSNVRAFYGTSSPQAQCGDLLERFSRIVMNEWRKDGADNRLKQAPTPSGVTESRNQAMARAAKLMQEMSHSKPSVTPNRPLQSNKRRPVLSQPTSRPSSVQRTASTEGRENIQPGNKTQAQGKQSTTFTSAPGTQAFLASLFTKGNTTAHPTSASANMMSKLQQQFGPTPAMGVATKKTATTPMRMSLSPRSQYRVLQQKEFAQVVKPVAGTKRPLENASVSKSPKRPHLAVVEPIEKETEVIMADVPTSRIAEVEKPDAAVKVKTPSPGRASKVVKPTGRSSPQAAENVEQKESAKTVVASLNVESAASPRRSPRSVQPTAKLLESGLQTRNRKTSSPATATDSSTKTVEKTNTTRSIDNVPQRMMTRGVAASISGTPRARRTTTV